MNTGYNDAGRPAGGDHALDENYVDTSRIPPERFRVNGVTPSRVFFYRAEAGKVVGTVARFEAGTLEREDKTFRQFRRNGQGFKLGLTGKALPIYRLPELLADPAATVLWVEGEKCADKLADLGFVVTTTAGGAKGFAAWLRKNPDGLQHLAGRDVVLLGDNDEDGRHYIGTVAEALLAVGCRVRVLDPLPWADIGNKADVADWIEAGHNATELRELIADTADYAGQTSGQTGHLEKEDAEPAESKSAVQDVEPLPPPPLDVLPAPVADYIAAVAAAYCVHPSMPFAFGLGVASSAVGRSADVLLRPDWREPVPLWIGVIASPGAVKSHVLKAVAEPMFTHDRELQDRHDSAIEQWKEATAEAKKRSKKGDEAELPQRPRRPQAVVSDTTIEALAGVLEISPRVLGRYDELKGLFDSMGCYKAKGGHDRQTWLSLHNGAELVINRKSQRNGDPLIVPCPRLGIVGTTTPGSAARLVRPEAGDGLLDRFFLVPSPFVKRLWSVPAIPEDLKVDWRERILNIARQAVDEPRPVRFTTEAGYVFGPWYESLVPEQSPGFVQGVVAKLAGHAGRIAMTLTALIDPGARWIEAKVVEAAIRIAEWLLACTVRARQNMLGADADSVNLSDRAAAALSWLRRHNRMASASEMIAGRIPGIRNAEDVKMVWGELETLKLGFRDMHRTAAGRDVEVFRLTQ